MRNSLAPAALLDRVVETIAPSLDKSFSIIPKLAKAGLSEKVIFVVVGFCSLQM